MARPRRRGYTRLVAFGLLAVLAAGLLVVRPDRSPERGDRPGPRAVRPAATVRPPRAVPPVPPRPSAGSDAAASRAAARGFLGGYLALLHGAGSLDSVAHGAPDLLRELRRDRPRVTPAQRQTGARILRLTAAVRSSGSARAVATLKHPGGPSFQLLLYLERRGPRRLVTRIGDA
jgi:hypothetical protein